MSEEGYKRQQRRRRQYLWLYIGILAIFVFSGNITFLPKTFSHPEYIPTIANGLVAAMSILMAFAFFSLSHYHTTIQDKNERWRYHLLAMIYLIILLSVLVLGIVIGYSFILNDALGNAINSLIISVIFIFGIIMDMWIVSDQFTFR